MLKHSTKPVAPKMAAARPKSPVIERPATLNAQKQMDAVVKYFNSASDITKYYGDITRARIIAEGQGIFVAGITTTKNRDLAVKMKDHLEPSERDMAEFAASAALTSRIYTTTRITVDPSQHWTAGILISDRVPGQPLSTIWPTIPSKDLPAFKKDITAQLAAQLARMRALRKPFIGRVGHHRDTATPQPTRNVYDGPVGGFFGPFAGADPEKAFDEWCLSQLPNVKDQAKWRPKLDKDRASRRLGGGGGVPPSFVLTHGDLNWRNIMVDKEKSAGGGGGGGGRYVITGIVDWEWSGFWPDYAEYVLMERVALHDREWVKVLREVVPKGGCSKERLEFVKVLQGACNPFLTGKF
jgi:hypothetical protein